MFRRMQLLAMVMGTSRLFEGGEPTPSLAQAKALADSANLSVDAQEQRAKDIIAAKDQVVADTQAALELAKANEVDQELIDKITAIGANAEDNFQAALATSRSAKRGSK
jgi:hypothetical protein